MPNLKVITIDFWNTLFDSQDGAIRNDRRLKVLFDTLRDLGINLDMNKLNKVIQNSWEYYSQIWENDFRTPSAKEILEYIWNKMHFNNNLMAIDYLADFFEKSILYFPPNLLPGAEEILKNLSKKYKLAIVSDTGFSPGSVMRELMQSSGILKYFSDFSFSNETGVSKPHPKAFNIILDNFDCKPEFALHIGDIERTDIEGAVGIGMQAIRFDGDPTSPLAKAKTLSSKANFIAKSWQDVYTYIEQTY